MSDFLERIGKLNLPKGKLPTTPDLVRDAAERLGLTLTLTSPSVPEQYDISRNGEPCGFVHTRRGHMSVRYPDVGGEKLYEGPVDGFAGFTEHEREAKLLFALSVIAARMLSK